MVLARARRSLPGLENRPAATIPDILRITIPPSAGMTVFNACAKPVLSQLLLVRECQGAQTGVWTRSWRRPSKARSVLVVNASHVAGRSGHLLQIHTARRGLNPSMLGIRPSMARSLHADSLAAWRSWANRNDRRPSGSLTDPFCLEPGDKLFLGVRALHGVERATEQLWVVDLVAAARYTITRVKQGESRSPFRLTRERVTT